MYDPKAGKPKLMEAVEDFRVDKVSTISSLPLNDQTPLVFNIQGQKGHFIDLSELKLLIGYSISEIGEENGAAELRLRRKKRQAAMKKPADKQKEVETGKKRQKKQAENQESGAADKKEDGRKSPVVPFPGVCTKSAPLYTLFEEMRIFLNNVCVYSGNFLYPFYANFILKMHGGKDLKETVGYYQDDGDIVTAFYFREDRTSVNWWHTENVPSWDDRVFNEKEYEYYREVMGPILFDLAFQKKRLKDDVSIKIELVPSKPSFSLFSSFLEEEGKEFVVRIKKAICYVPRYEVNPSFIRNGSRDPYTYYFVDRRLENYAIPEKTINFDKQVINGRMPKRLSFWLVSQKAFHGSLQHSPFNTCHNFLEQIQLRTSTGKNFPQEPLQPQFFDGENLRETYVWARDNLKGSLEGKQFPLTMKEFEDGNFFISFDLTKNFSAGAKDWTLMDTGTGTLHLQFEQGLEEDVICIVLSEFEKQCTIDELGEVVVEDAPIYNNDH